MRALNSLGPRKTLGPHSWRVQTDFIHPVPVTSTTPGTTHTHTPPSPHTCTHSSPHTPPHPLTHTYPSPHIHTHSDTHTHTCSDTHTHTRILTMVSSPSARLCSLLLVPEPLPSLLGLVFLSTWTCSSPVVTILRLTLGFSISIFPVTRG